MFDKPFLVEGEINSFNGGVYSLPKDVKVYYTGVGLRPFNGDEDFKTETLLVEVFREKKNLSFELSLSMSATSVIRYNQIEKVGTLQEKVLDAAAKLGQSQFMFEMARMKKNIRQSISYQIMYQIGSESEESGTFQEYSRNFGFNLEDPKARIYYDQRVRFRESAYHLFTGEEIKEIRNAFV